MEQNFPEELNMDDAGMTITEEKIRQDRSFLKSLHALESDQYRIAPGDKFNIYVYNESDLDTEGIIVKMDGTITCKLIGEIQVKDLSIPRATSEIESALKKYVHYPKVSLIPYEMRSSSFTIMGKVTQPGFYYFDGSIRLADAIAKAESILSSHGLIAFVILGNASLPECYTDRRGIPVGLVMSESRRGRTSSGWSCRSLRPAPSSASCRPIAPTGCRWPTE